MFFTFKLLPSDEDVPSTGMYRQSLSEEKTKGSSRPLAEAKADWAYAMSLPSLLEEAMVFLFFLADLLPRSTFSAAILHLGGGEAKNLMKASL